MVSTPIKTAAKHIEDYLRDRNARPWESVQIERASADLATIAFKAFLDEFDKPLPDVAKKAGARGVDEYYSRGMDDDFENSVEAAFRAVIRELRREMGGPAQR